MPRKTRRPPEFRVPTGSVRPVLWPRYAAIAFVFAALGAGAMYAALRPALRRAAAPRPAAIVASNAPSGPADTAVAPAPPPALTAGLPPAQAALNAANWYEDHAQYPQAIASYTQAINGGLDSPDARTDLGVALYKSGQPQKALAQYLAAQSQNPRHENSLFNQGAAYAVLGQPERAVRVWRAYLSRFPQGQHVGDARQLIKEINGHASAQPPAPDTPPASPP